LNPMIKVVNLVSLLAAPIIVQSGGGPIPYGVAAVMLGAIVWAILQSKKPTVTELPVE
jgi:K(+)-stimulated pyrophosphate-energized sodium pump